MIKKYSVFCNDEQKHVVGFSDVEPTTCFNNNTHAIDTPQTSIVAFDIAEVYINQSNETNNAFYFSISVNHQIEPDETKEMEFKFDVDSNLYQVLIYTKSSNIGDYYDTFLNKNTLVAVVIETATDSSSITVSDASNIRVGFYVSFNTVDQYRVIGKTNNTITIDTPVSISSGSLVYLTYYFVKNKMIINEGATVLGGSIIGSFKIPAGSIGGMTYYNKSSSIKYISMDLETTF